MERVFQNADGTAFLDKGIFANSDLLDKCIAEVKPQLEYQQEMLDFSQMNLLATNIPEN